jgi:hypothetical protein
MPQRREGCTVETSLGAGSAQPCHIPWIEWEPQIGCGGYYSGMNERKILGNKIFASNVC